MRGGRFWRIAALAVLGGAAGGLASGAAVEDELIGADVALDARALGMGGATVSRARGLDAVLTNPAGLAALPRSEIAGSATWRDVGLDSTWSGSRSTASVAGARIGSAGVAYRAATRRGVGLGVAYNQVRDLGLRSYTIGVEREGDLAGFDVAEERETLGNIGTLTFAGGVEVSDGVRLGVAADVWDGGRDRFVRLEARDASNLAELSTLVFDDAYGRSVSGTRLKLGVDLGLMPGVSLGGTVILPTDLDIREDWAQFSEYAYDDGSVDRDRDSGITDYTLHLPAELRGGAATRIGAVIVSGEVRYVDWTRAYYSPAPARDVSRNQFRQSYSASLEGRVGAEWELSPDAALRAGLAAAAQPMQWVHVERQPLTLSAGFSRGLGGNTVVDVAYLFTTWERTVQGVVESSQTHRLVAGARLLF
jgi:hypothetical protein